MCMLDTSRFEFIEKLLNTPDIKSILGKLDDSGKWNQHGRGENVVNRFEFEFSEIDEDEREELVKSGFKEIKYKFNVIMYLNTDKSYIDCDGLWYDYNVDPAWWEADVIPKKILKLLGLEHNIESRIYIVNIIVKSRDGEHIYCEEYK